MADKAFLERRTVTITEVAAETGIARRVLSSLANEHGYNTGTDNISKLCQFFSCSVEEVMQFVPDEPISTGPEKKGAHKSVKKK